jgi:hypothetical protein
VSLKLILAWKVASPSCLSLRFGYETSSAVEPNTISLSVMLGGVVTVRALSPSLGEPSQALGDRIQFYLFLLIERSVES